MSDSESKQRRESEEDAAQEEMRRFEQRDELPKDLKQWPGGKAKYLTFDSAEEDPYGEGLTEKLGPPVTHHEDGSVSINGEKVDNPEQYKGDPIPMATDVEQVGSKRGRRPEGSESQEGPEGHGRPEGREPSESQEPSERA